MLFFFFFFGNTKCLAVKQSWKLDYVPASWIERGDAGVSFPVLNSTLPAS